MLIQSNRHTDADLKLWQKLEAADEAAYQLLRTSGKIEKSLSIIRDWICGRDCYVSFSGGKDSVTVADLVHRVDDRVPIIWIREVGLENPHCQDVAQAYLSGHPRTLYAEVPVFHENIHRFSDGTRPENSAESSAFKHACDNAVRMFGGRVMGIRKVESAIRRASARWHGHATDNVCRPILDWKTNEVFAYLAGRDLPVHPDYAMLGGGRYKREHLRVDCLWGPQGQEFGRHEWEQEYYSDCLRKIELICHQ